MRLQKLAEEFQIDIIIHGFATTATFKGTHDAYGGHIKDAIVKEQLKTPTSLCNGFDILEALKNSKNLLGVNNPIDPDKQSMMKVTGLHFVLLVREDDAEIDKQYNNVNTSINKDAASIIKSRIADPNNYDIATICSSTKDAQNFNESTKIVAQVRCNHTQRILLKDPKNNNQTTFAVRKEHCECDHCRISDFDKCPHEFEVGKFIDTAIYADAKALSDAEKLLKADVTNKFNLFKDTDFKLRKMIQRTHKRMNQHGEGPEAPDAREYCSCNYHNKSGNRKRKYDDTITAVDYQMIMCDGLQLEDGSFSRTPACRLWYHPTCLTNLGMEQDDIASDKITCPPCTDYINALTMARTQLTEYNLSKSALLQQFPEASLTEKQQINIEEGSYDPKHNVTHDRQFETQALDYLNYPDDYFQ